MAMWSSRRLARKCRELHSPVVHTVVHQLVNVSGSVNRECLKGVHSPGTKDCDWRGFHQRLTGCFFSIFDGLVRLRVFFRGWTPVSTPFASVASLPMFDLRVVKTVLPELGDSNYKIGFWRFMRGAQLLSCFEGVDLLPSPFPVILPGNVSSRLLSSILVLAINKLVLMRERHFG
jgi:hypothetical protein